MFLIVVTGQLLAFLSEKSNSINIVTNLTNYICFVVSSQLAATIFVYVHFFDEVMISGFVFHCSGLEGAWLVLLAFDTFGLLVANLLALVFMRDPAFDEFLKIIFLECVFLS